MSTSDFEADFRTLTGKPPFPWQADLHRRFVAGEFPPSCCLPTGLGKTSVVPIWLIALAAAPQATPRRLVYVVNRRAVVDQATQEAEEVRRRLRDAPELEKRLRELSAGVDPGGEALAVSTLRGEFADNGAWRLDPSRPAVVVGTVDMIGSRLLFSGYRCGFKSRPLHAGFLGRDVLLVHDEAHLEPAFQTLLEAMRAEQSRSEPSGAGIGRFHVMELSATSRGSGRPFELTAEEKEGRVEEVRLRLQSEKRISLHPVPDEKSQLADRVAEAALEHRESSQAVAVFLRKVGDVEKVAKRLSAAAPTVLLTGTLRGLERDQLAGTRSGLEGDQLAKANAVFARFSASVERRAAGTPGTVYLVCTSAGEVGVNISADHLVCDLTPFESMAQRLGRVNRFGRSAARVDVHHAVEFDEKSAYELRRERTLALLQRLNGDGSPQALGRLPVEDRLEAYSPPPEIVPTSDVLFDAWTCTSIREPLPGRPPVKDFLHGVSEWEPPETYVAWRSEVERVHGELLELFPPQDLLDDFPLKPHELLRDGSERVFGHLKRLSEDHPKKPVWLSTEDDVQVSTLAELVEKGKEAIFDATVILPPSVGGLTPAGMLGGGEARDDLDVADQWLDGDGRPRRRRIMGDGERPAGMRLVRSIPLELPRDEDESPLAEVEEERGEASIPSPTEWKWYVRAADADDDGSGTSAQAQELAPHQAQVAAVAQRFATALGLPADVRQALSLAGSWHDAGKARRSWQLRIGNLDARRPLAKSASGGRPLLEDRYRHEFGSLLDLRASKELRKEPTEVQELTLHLIAAHHGRGRPYFPPEECFDPDYDQNAVAAEAAETPLRFARLQRRYGRWGLAYLESLLRAADAYASACPAGETP